MEPQPIKVDPNLCANLPARGSAAQASVRRATGTPSAWAASSRSSNLESGGRRMCKELTHWKKTLMLGKTEGGKRRGRQRMRWLDGIVSLSKVRAVTPWIAAHQALLSMDSPRKNTGRSRAGGERSLSLLQEIFPTQGSNPGLPHCRWILYQLSPGPCIYI